MSAFMWVLRKLTSYLHRSRGTFAPHPRHPRLIEIGANRCENDLLHVMETEVNEIGGAQSLSFQHNVPGNFSAGSERLLRFSV